MYTNIALIIQIVGLINCFRTITVLPSSRAALNSYEVLSFVLKKNLNASKPSEHPPDREKLVNAFIIILRRTKESNMPASTGAKNPRAQWILEWRHIGTGIVGTIGYVVLPTGVSTDVSRDIV